ncbi:uncharacterized protein LOC115442967 [Manduca sexta]|uniref:uncharacterized protein LOC115442967 n=1 Tax=Manduca sexta TaxID=7130 RepID=UPI0011830757|nr:uncharacterized protein LOC115442967 [Manduca sexta]
MDRIIKAGSSQIDSIIECIRNKVESFNEEPVVKKLTVHANETENREDSKHRIDREISQLESVIKKLQNEINEMASNSDQSKQEFRPEVTDDIDKDLLIPDADPEKMIPQIIKSIDLNARDDTNFPVKISYSKDLKIADSQKSIVTVKPKVEDEIPDSEYWDDGLEQLVRELKSEINDKMDSMEDVEPGESSQKCNKSEMS